MRTLVQSNTRAARALTSRTFIRAAAEEDEDMLLHTQHTTHEYLYSTLLVPPRASTSTKRKPLQRVSILSMTEYELTALITTVY